MHWADVVAVNLAKRGNSHIVSTGITPSGEFHIGHLREILTGDMIAKTARKHGMDVEFIFIVDDADPLRRVYPFLHEDYHQYIGHQIGNIPAPDEDGKPDVEGFEKSGRNYADHFLQPFLQALEKIDVKPKIIKNLESYNSGKFSETIKIACDRADDIREIIERVSGRELNESWFPWSPVDSSGSLEGVTVTGYDYPHVFFTDSSGNEGVSDITEGKGKLPWRIDWPAKWAWIGVSCEAFGKDHGASGGSYDTGKEISELFSYQAPYPLVYEWISLKGQGAMSSSHGNTIGPMEALELVPAEILRYLIAQSKPNKAIEFDAGMSLVNLADEYERVSARDFIEELNDDSLSRRRRVQIEDAKGAVELSRINNSDNSESTRVSFRHLALLAQTKSSDDLIWKSLGFNVSEEVPEMLLERLEKMKNWINSKHFPDEMRITILDEPNTEMVANFGQDEKAVLENMYNKLCDCMWDAKTIGNAIVESAKELDLSAKIGYNVAYACLMGTQRGPRLAPILVELERDKITNLLKNSLDLL